MIVRRILVVLLACRLFRSDLYMLVGSDELSMSLSLLLFLLLLLLMLMQLVVVVCVWSDQSIDRSARCSA
jgi:hypothetical protein